MVEGRHSNRPRITVNLNHNYWSQRERVSRDACMLASKCTRAWVRVRVRVRLRVREVHTGLVAIPFGGIGVSLRLRAKSEKMRGRSCVSACICMISI